MQLPLLVRVSLGLYGLALICPAIVPNSPGAPGELFGYECLFLGPLSWMISSFMIVAWNANVAYLLILASAALPRRLCIPPWMGLIPLVLASAVLFVKESIADPEGASGGGMVDIHLASGAWLWLLSMLVAALIPYAKKMRQ